MTKKGIAFKLAALSLSLLCMNSYAADDQSMMTPAANQTQAQPTPSEGIAFLAENKKKSSVITLPDGLQYKIITEGKGEKPSENDMVTVNYVGTLINGAEFDNSYKRGEPATFPVNGVIPGWTEALKLMPAGSTWELYIPSELAYGQQGASPMIGPNQTLIFKVDLISIKKR